MTTARSYLVDLLNPEVYKNLGTSNAASFIQSVGTLQLKLQVMASACRLNSLLDSMDARFSNLNYAIGAATNIAVQAVLSYAPIPSIPGLGSFSNQAFKIFVSNGLSSY